MARRRSGKKIDFVHWTGFNVESLAQSVGSVAATALAAQHDPETSLRCRGEWTAHLDATQAPGSRVLVSVGLILVPENTGTTVLWAPFTDSDASWIWYDQAVLGYEEMVTDVIDVPGMTSVRRVIDNKAMRIVRNSELQFVVQDNTLGSAASVNVSCNGRVLSGT